MIFSLRYPAGCSCFFLHLLFEKGEVNPARYEKRGSRKMACIMGCPAAHNNAALRELPEINRREMEAVRQAIAETLTLDTGQERIQVIRCVFWDKTHTLEGAAMKLHRCKRTVAQWHGEFIRCVAKYFGLL
jgi:predicted DNA-binding protein (UPF0251 family)